jgi:hypothetical protein
MPIESKCPYKATTMSSVAATTAASWISEDGRVTYLILGLTSRTGRAVRFRTKRAVRFRAKHSRARSDRVLSAVRTGQLLRKATSRFYQMPLLPQPNCQRSSTQADSNSNLLKARCQLRSRGSYGPRALKAAPTQGISPGKSRSNSRPPKRRSFRPPFRGPNASSNHPSAKPNPSTAKRHRPARPLSGPPPVICGDPKGKE